jgi:hypothetical protein
VSAAVVFSASEMPLAVPWQVSALEDLTSTFQPYQTLSEGIKLVAQAFTKDGVTSL